MVFNIRTAEKVIGFYKHLVGKPFRSSISDLEIINIVIAPEDEIKFENFIDKMQTTMDNEFALSKTGFNPNRVKIILMASHLLERDIQVHVDLDEYLRKNFISRVYLNPYYFE